ncbi:gamma-glutamyltransferase family protein, partial [Xanthomonas campestris]
MRCVPALLVSALALLAPPSGAADRITGQPFATRSEVIAPHAMAATSQPLATQIALDVMKDGGSAVDAAIAANAALGLMEPTGNGVGGDLFAIVWDPKTNKLYGYNGSGRSPKSLTLAEFQRRGLKDIPPTGPLPVSVPGAVDGWFALHGRFGRKPMAQDLAPAIRYAREGHPVAETIAYYWDRSVPRLSQYPGFKEQFTLDGHAPRKGELWKNPNLANTLQQIADGGRDAFYKGEIARTIGAYFKANGGFLSYEDLASHQGEWVEPVSTNYRGYDVWELPPNSQGIAALQMLNILEGYDFSKIGFGSTEHVHLFTEAKKLAFADRARFYADPAFQPAPLAKLISKDYAAQRRALISMDKALKEVQPGTPKQLEEGDTIYMTVADADGMMVSLIQSNYRGMGSGMAPPGLGFILQDRGEMFVLKKDHPNGYAPGKRPFQTIIPAFVTKDGKPWLRTCSRSFLISADYADAPKDLSERHEP